MQTKQVIVIRKDLKMRQGKVAAQASHSSMSFLTKNIKFLSLRSYESGDTMGIEVPLRSKEFFHEVESWLRNSFTKICVYVNSEEELIQVHQAALAAGLESHLVEDNGATEFKGVKTKTCLAVGPHEISKFIGVTDHLPLL